MRNATNRASSLFIPQMTGFRSAGCAIDIGGTFNDSNWFISSALTDNISLANDWGVVGDELRKSMCYYEP